MTRLEEITRDTLKTLLELMREYYAHDRLEFDRDKAERAVIGMVQIAQGRIWLILEDDTVMGYVVLIWSYSLEYGGLAAELDELYLKPEARGRGIGREALRQFLEFCRSAGVVLLRLETEPDNEAARGFYKALGFEVVERRFMQLEF
jgi:ribosomal protein S18 acetylase RimI-like enzyme